jgi:hypothetical protein
MLPVFPTIKKLSRLSADAARNLGVLPAASGDLIA